MQCLTAPSFPTHNYLRHFVRTFQAEFPLFAFVDSTDVFVIVLVPPYRSVVRRFAVVFTPFTIKMISKLCAPTRQHSQISFHCDACFLFAVTMGALFRCPLNIDLLKHKKRQIMTTALSSILFCYLWLST